MLVKKECRCIEWSVNLVCDPTQTKSLCDEHADCYTYVFSST